MLNTLYFGDNLDILREHIADESIDLIYLDPPFNSKRDYNLLFKTPKGHASEAQITAFEDSWHWGDQAEHEFEEILHQSNTDAAEMIQSLRRFLHENDMMAYLVMMCNRLLELHRVLKPTGSLYLHCDDTASHYLKFALDAIFGVQNYRNQIVWRRTESHNDSNYYGRVTDIILFYTKSSTYIWNQPTGQRSVKQMNRYHADENGRLFRYENLTAPGVRHGETGKEWRGVNPTPKGYHWKFIPSRLEEMFSSGQIVLRKDGTVRLDGWKVYLDETPAPAVQNWWDDIPRISNTSAERMGYPTQKPLALLERIINASSNASGVVLDPFCGCGTAIHAAQKLGRQWIGIDITPLAISLIEKRMKEAFPTLQFEVEGIPKDLDGAKDLAARDKYHFQWWACALVGAQPYQGKKKGADSGIDGVIYFSDDKGPAKKIVVSVKGGETVTVSQIRDLAHVVDREQAAIGLFVTLASPTKPMKVEAVSAGHYQSPNFGAFDKLQILTIEGLLTGTEAPHYPDLSRGSTGSKKARVEQVQGQQGELL